MTDTPERICFVNCGLPGDQCACFRDMDKPHNWTLADNLKKILDNLDSAPHWHTAEDRIVMPKETEYIRRDAVYDLPEVRALVKASTVVHNSYWNDSDGVIRGMYDLEIALSAIKAKP